MQLLRFSKPLKPRLCAEIPCTVGDYFLFFRHLLQIYIHKFPQVFYYTRLYLLVVVCDLLVKG